MAGTSRTGGAAAPDGACQSLNGILRAPTGGPDFAVPMTVL